MNSAYDFRKNVRTLINTSKLDCVNGLEELGRVLGKSSVEIDHKIMMDMIEEIISNSIDNGFFYLGGTMPFTFSHPAYAVPLKYVLPGGLSVTGLILGSMAPDFEYFILLEPHSMIGHSLWGLLLEAIPLSLLLAYIFHYVVKGQLILHLPSTAGLNGRAYRLYGEWRLRGWRDWAGFIGSVIIGFFTHIFVDAFTHASGYFVLRYPILQESVLHRVPLYKVLQHSLSSMGLLLEVIIIINMLFRHCIKPAVRIPNIPRGQKLIFWLYVLIVAVCVTLLKLVMTGSTNLIGMLAVAPLSGAVLGIALASYITGRT